MTTTPAGPTIIVPPHGLRLGDALEFGWLWFKPNAARWVGLVLLVGLLWCAATLPVWWFTIDENSTALVETDPLGIVGDFWGLITGTLASAVLVRAALLQSEGTRPSVDATFSILRRSGVWRYAFVAAIPLELLDLMVSGLSVLLGIVGSFVTLILVEKDIGVWAAFLSGLELVRHNLGGSLIMYFGTGFVVVASLLVCGVGILAAIPCAFLAYVYAYRVLTTEGAQDPIANS